jgi:hypothetical protein
MAINQNISSGKGKPGNDTKLYLHFDADNNSTFIKDSSTSQKTTTIYGNAKVTNNSPTPKFGKGELWLETDGAVDYVKINNNSDLNLVGDFNLDAHVFLTARPAGSGDNYGAIMSRGTSGSNDYWILADSVEEGKVGFRFLAKNSANETIDITSDNQPVLNTWYYVAVSRKGTSTDNVRLYVGSVTDLAATASRQTQAGTATNDFSPNDDIYIGRYSDETKGFMKGRIDEIRIRVGKSKDNTQLGVPIPTRPTMQ